MVTLPSKKVLSVFILVAALVVSIIVAFGRDKASSAINFTSNLVVGDKVLMPENPNWQNELGKVSASAAITKTEESTSTEETLTDVVSRTFMSNYLALKESGNLSSSSAQDLIDKTLEYIGHTETGGQAVQVSQLNVVADNGKQSVMDYGENLGMILKINKPKDPKEGLSIFSQAVQSNSPSKINELDGIIAVYQKVAGELVKMPVPKTFVKAHLDITNGVKGGIIALTEMKAVFSDPFKGLSAVQLYQNSVITFTQAFRATNDFLKQNNVVYKQGSGGYYLLYGL
jgi:hypothetical protein